jgi:hypothetical protein
MPIIATVEANVPLLELPNIGNAGTSWFATDTGNFYTADQSGNIQRNPFAYCVVSDD